MTPQPKFALCSYSSDSATNNLGIYKAGPVVDLTKVVVLNEHDSTILLDIQSRLANMAKGDRSVCMQHIVRAFYDAAPESGESRPAEA